VVPEGPVTAISSLDHDLKTVCETLITAAWRKLTMGRLGKFDVWFLDVFGKGMV